MGSARGERGHGGRAVSKLLLMVASQEVNLLPRPKYLPESMNRVTRSIWSGAPAMPRITYTLIKHPVSSMAASVRSSRMPPSSGSDFGVRQLANPDRKNPDLARTPLPGAERVKYCYVGGSPVLLPLPPNIWEGLGHHKIAPSSYALCLCVPGEEGGVDGGNPRMIRALQSSVLTRLLLLPRDISVPHPL